MNQRSVSYVRIQLNEIKPAQIDFCDKNLSESLSKNAFNYDESNHDIITILSTILEK